MYMIVYKANDSNNYFIEIMRENVMAINTSFKIICINLSQEGVQLRFMSVKLAKRALW